MGSADFWLDIANKVYPRDVLDFYSHLQAIMPLSRDQHCVLRGPFMSCAVFVKALAECHTYGRP